MLSELQIYVVEAIPFVCIDSLLLWQCHPASKHHHRPGASIRPCSHLFLGALKQNMRYYLFANIYLATMAKKQYGVNCHILLFSLGRYKDHHAYVQITKLRLCFCIWKTYFHMCNPVPAVRTNSEAVSSVWPSGPPVLQQQQMPNTNHNPPKFLK